MPANHTNFAYLEEMLELCVYDGSSGIPEDETEMPEDDSELFSFLVDSICSAVFTGLACRF